MQTRIQTSGKMEYTKDLSIVISLFNEEESLPELIGWIEKVVTKEQYSYEILMIDDGSTDSSWKVIKNLFQMLTGKKVSIGKMIPKAQERKALYDRLEVFEETEDEKE